MTNSTTIETLAANADRNAKRAAEARNATRSALWVTDPAAAWAISDEAEAEAEAARDAWIAAVNASLL